MQMTSPCGHQDTRSRRKHQQLPGRAIFFYLGQLSTDLRTKVTLFTPNPAQVELHDNPRVNMAHSALPLKRSPKILGVYIDTTLSYHLY